MSEWIIFLKPRVNEKLKVYIVVTKEMVLCLHLGFVSDRDTTKEKADVLLELKDFTNEARGTL